MSRVPQRARAGEYAEQGVRTGRTCYNRASALIRAEARPGSTGQPVPTTALGPSGARIEASTPHSYYIPVVDGVATMPDGRTLRAQPHIKWIEVPFLTPDEKRSVR